jgi:cytochrome c6
MDGMFQLMRARPTATLLAVILTAVIGLTGLGLLLGPDPALAASAPELSAGAGLFEQHCVGCHVHGGNIIRRGKTLRLAALERNGINGPEQIAAIAAGGQGQMSGYGAVLGDGGPEAVAAYVWQQAQLDWP